MPIFGDENAYEITSLIEDVLGGGKYSCPATGSAQSISVGIDSWPAGAKCKCAIYDAAKNFIAETEEKTDGGTGWVVFSFASPPDLSVADYILIVWADSAVYMKANPGGPASSYWYQAATYGTFPTPIGDPTSSYYKSIYCTYTVSGAGWTGKINGVANPAKVLGIAVADITKVNGVS